jgi:hypothetical protein
MGKILLSWLVLGLMCSVAAAADRKGIRFWNLTSSTVAKLQLSPAGKEAWGPDQCRNDPDGTVDHDERLRITGIGPGRYDVRLAYKDGRACTVRNVEVKDGAVFSIQDKDLTDCSK